MLLCGEEGKYTRRASRAVQDTGHAYGQTGPTLFSLGTPRPCSPASPRRWLSERDLVGTWGESQKNPGKGLFGLGSQGDSCNL